MDGCEINVNKLIRNLFVLQGTFVNLYNTADSNFLVNNYLFGQVKHKHQKGMQAMEITSTLYI